MEFKELLEKDKYKVYSDWMSIKEAKESGKIPVELHEILSDRCKCGSERIIKNNLKSYTCCDPECHIKQSFKLEKILKSFSAQRLGYSSCEKILTQMKKYLKGNNIFDYLNEVDKTQSLYLTHTIEYNLRTTIKNMKSKQLTFPEVVSIMALPGIESTALKLFRGIDSYVELIRMLTAYESIELFFSDRGVKDSSVIQTVMTSLEEIESAWKMFESKSVKSANITINIVMTGPSKLDGVSRSKNYLIEYFNNLCIDSNGIRHFNIKSGKSLSTAGFFIAQSNNNSTSYRAARTREIEEDTRLIFTADEFSDMLKAYMSNI